MGKSKKPKTQVTQYYMSEHLGVCVGHVDAVNAIYVDEKIIGAPSGGSLSVNNQELFGGIRKEGGVQGTVTVLDGNSSQVLPDALAQKLGRSGGSDAPGFRGLLSLFFTSTPISSNGGFYFRANSPFLPGVWATVQRILKTSTGDDQWYPEKALIRSYDSGNLISSQTISIDSQADAATTIGGAISGNRGTVVTTSSSNVVVVEPVEGGTTNLAWHPGGSNDWQWTVNAITSPSNGPRIGASAQGATPALARQNMLEENPRGIQLSGSGSYRFCIVDSPTFDNTGTIDIQVSIYPADVIDMNPAHIIRECLTDSTWGMGTPTTSLDEDSFVEAADTLFNEGFGLSMIWTRQASIERFVQEVLDHIQAVLYTDPATGLLTLDLIRGDYDESSLAVLDPDNADLSNFSRKLWGDIINEIVVTWTNPANEQDETITVQDNASIAIQGGIVSDGRNYYGVRTRNLAQELAFRDLRSAGQPLASCSVEVDRSQYLLRPGSVIKVTWPEYSLTELVFRVQSVDYGRPGDPTIKAELIEDVYGLDIGSYDAPPGTLFEDPAAAPSDLDPVQIFTLSYYFAVNSSVSAEVTEPVYPEAAAGILAGTDNGDTWGYDLHDEVTLPNGSTEDQRLATNNIIGYAELSQSLDVEGTTSSLPISNIEGNTSPLVGGFVIIGPGDEALEELALVDADNGDGTFDLVRGALDTVPRAWPAGTRIWFVNDTTSYEDPLIRSAGEVVDYSLLSKTSQGTLDIGDSTLQSYTLTERFYLPLRPANVQVDGVAFSSLTNPIDAQGYPTDLSVTWSNRNRLTEDTQVLAWSDATVTPESGQTTTIETRTLDGDLIATHDGLTGTSFDVPESSFGAEDIIEVRVYSERTDADGDFASLQYFAHIVQVNAAARLTEEGAYRLTEQDELRLTED